MYIVCPRRALVALGCVLLLGWAPAAQATNFKITSTKIDPKVGGLSGTIHDTYHSGYHTKTLTESVSIGRLELTGTSNGQSVTFDTYCADIFSALGPGTFSNELTSTLGLSTVKLNQLTTFLANADALVTSTHNSVYSAAAQLGVWEILNETTSSYNLTIGSFYASGSALTTSFHHQDTAVQLANLWLKDVTSSVWKPIPGAELGVLDAARNQAQIYIIHHQLPPPSDAVPEPASWLLMIAGFSAVGAMLRRQRRGAEPDPVRS